MKPLYKYIKPEVLIANRKTKFDEKETLQQQKIWLNKPGKSEEKDFE